MSYEALPFRKYTYKAELDKALHTLEGLIKGVAIDNEINKREFLELDSWYKYHRQLVNRHPFNELIPLIGKSLEDGVIESEERQDILWLCQSLRTSNQYYDIITADIQRLQGILHGILSDNRITEDELRALHLWLEDNIHLAKSYPYDEIYSLIVTVLSDGIIDEEENKILKVFFRDFVNTDSSKFINNEDIQKLKKDVNISGICSVCPEIGLPNKMFCFTGISSKTTRKGFADIVISLGGLYQDTVTTKTDYLVVGNNGNPCWAFSCYGRKVEAAVNLRKKGREIILVHENDFWDTLEDFIWKK